MKGVVFTEFLNLVENIYSADMVDDIIDSANLASGGAYTAVGTYDHGEMGKLLIELSKRTEATVPELLKAYGQHLFDRFFEDYPQLFEGIEESFGFLDTIENVIHVEVKKLYPDAELPEIETVEISTDHMKMIYRSPRCLGDFAEGLMQGCFKHFKDDVLMTRKDEHEGRIVKFELHKST